MSLKERCLKIELFLSDVDGVLTDSGMYYTEAGDELKKFSTLDGGGFMLLKFVGIASGLITSESTKIVERRAQKLKIDHIIQGTKNKVQDFEKLITSLELSPDQVAYIGDDINDIPLLQRVGVSATVPGNCFPKDVSCDYITRRPGGNGAVRDFAEWLLQQRGQYDDALSSYFQSIQP